MGRKKQLKRAHAELKEVIARNKALTEENRRLQAQLVLAQPNPYATGPKRPNRKKLSSREVTEIRSAHRNGMAQRGIAEAYDVNPATISRIVRGIYH